MALRPNISFAAGKGHVHKMTVDDDDNISGENFPQVYNHGPVL
jgi:hypothetical protein